jgi:hypothetical protein
MNSLRTKTPAQIFTQRKLQHIGALASQTSKFDFCWPDHRFVSVSQTNHVDTHPAPIFRQGHQKITWMETVGDIVIVPFEFQNSADPEFASMPTEFVVLANVSLIDWLRQEGPS